MNPALILALVDGALSLIEKFSPVIKELFQKGDITVEQQKAIKDRIDALRSSEAFVGSEWEVKD